MKEEKKDKVFLVVNTIIFYTALIGSVITMIFGYPHLDFPDDWIIYIVGTVVFTVAYYVGFYAIGGIIGLLIAFIICLFEKINKKYSC